MTQIKIDLFFYGALKNYYGSKLGLMILTGTDLNGILRILKEMDHKASEILDSCKMAIDSEFAEPGYTISKPVEIVLLPPFSGG
jgi:molybdopterin converting factor small subunit